MIISYSQDKCLYVLIEIYQFIFLEYCPRRNKCRRRVVVQKLTASTRITCCIGVYYSGVCCSGIY